jgi:CheY-like chemotaxis protein
MGLNYAAKTVLVAEDYEDSRMLLKHKLELLGYRVLEAADGYEAVECATEHHPDLILMDMAMPFMDGLDAARYIKEGEKTSDVPIICLTAHTNSYAQKAMHAGCDMVISKPIDLNNLKPIISMFLDV